MPADQFKLLLLNYEYPPIGGGGGFGCEKLAQALSRNLGYRVTVLTAGVGSQITESIDDFGVRVIRLPCSKNREHRSSATFSFMLRYLISACFYILKNRKLLSFDVISTQFALPTGPVGEFASRVLKIPNVLTVHGGEIFTQPLELTGYGFPISWVTRFLVKSAHAVTANSTDTMLATQRFLKVDRDISVISTGFAEPNVSPPSNDRMISNVPVKLIMVSRLVPRKNLSDLLSALAGLKDLSWTLDFVGDGPEELKLKKLAQSLGVQNRVFFNGFVTEEKKFDLLVQSDVFVLPTLHEGLGLVYFEAMRCGLPIVTTNNGGQTDFLNDEENALLVPIRDVVALQNALRRAITDPPWRLQCGLANAQKIKTLTVENFLPDYDRVFRGVKKE